jgi:hypothetical protein
VSTLRASNSATGGGRHWSAVGLALLGASPAVSNWDRAYVYAVGASAAATLIAVIVALIVANRGRRATERALDLAKTAQQATERWLEVAVASQRVAEDALNVAIDERVGQRRANLAVEATSQQYGALGDLIRHRAVVVNNGPNIARQVRVVRSLDAHMRLYLRQRESEQTQGASERSEISDEVGEVEVLAPNERAPMIGLVPDLDSNDFSTVTLSWVDGNGEHSQTKRVPLG